MNGTANKSMSQSMCSPAYSLLRDVTGGGVGGGHENHNSKTVGRYTAVGQRVTKRNGHSTQGSYQPVSQQNGHYAHSINAGRRSQSQHQVTSTNGYATPIPNGGYQNSYTDLINKETAQHTKSHSVTSTLFLRESAKDSNVGVKSLSCGQPSPSSTIDNSVQSIVSPNSVRITLNSSRPQQNWLHQSELSLPTDRDSASTQAIDNYTKQIAVSVTDLGNRHKYYNGASNPNLELNESSEVYASANMIYGSRGRNDSEEYINNYSTGPSYRKIQTLHGTGSAQRRYPSDTTLNFNPREGHQVYTSGTKPGPVTIPARSRSAQPSPGQSPLASPNTCYRASESNLLSDYPSTTDKRFRSGRAQQIDMNYGTQIPNRGTSSPPKLEKSKLNSFSADGPMDDNESPILPSVREIIRQVEAMTQSNAATSTSDISAMIHGTNSGIPRFNRQTQPQQQQQPRKPITGTDQFARGGILRQGSSQRTPSAPQLRSIYTPIQTKFNASVSPVATNPPISAPPVPPHGTQMRSKAIIGAFTRRVEPSYNEVNQMASSHKKIEQLSNLPTDYQKLREAFIEQRREIQRLRKQLAEKDVLISQLQNDIRLYEPWR